MHDLMLFTREPRLQQKSYSWASVDMIMFITLQIEATIQPDEDKAFD
jgi:hypothetical protein